MNGGSTPGERRRFAFAAPENFTAPNADCPSVFWFADSRQARDEPKPP